MQLDRNASLGKPNPIARIDGRRIVIVTAIGQTVAADAIVLATGLDAVRQLLPLAVGPDRHAWPYTEKTGLRARDASAASR